MLENEAGVDDFCGRMKLELELRKEFKVFYFVHLFNETWEQKKLKAGSNKECLPPYSDVSAACVELLQVEWAHLPPVALLWSARSCCSGWTTANL